MVEFLEEVDSLPCCCRWIREHSRCDFSDSAHVAVALEDLDLPTQLAMFKSANANSTYFYSRQPFLICFPFDFIVGRHNRAFHFSQMRKFGILHHVEHLHLDFRVWISAADFIRSVEHTHPRESAVRISRIPSFKATRTKSQWATTTVFSISIQFCTRDEHLNST